MITRQIGSFLIHEEIARGHLGVIHRAEHVLTHELVAVKIVALTSLSPSQNKEVETELRYLMSITSPKVVRLKEYLRTATYMYLFMEYCGGGSLGSYIMNKGPAQERLAKQWLRDVAEGLSDMKRANAMHRDVKLSHILLTSTDESARAKLSGTGFSRFALENTATRSVLGTPLFMAPEILRREAYGYNVDVWSLGVTAYWLLLGVEPFQVTTLEQLQAAQRVPIVFNQYCTLSSEAQSFIMMLMQYQPEKRPTYEQILAHPFLQEQPQLISEIEPVRPATIAIQPTPPALAPVQNKPVVEAKKEPKQPSTAAIQATFPMETVTKEVPKPATLIKPVDTPKPTPAVTPEEHKHEESKQPSASIPPSFQSISPADTPQKPTPIPPKAPSKPTPIPSEESKPTHQPAPPFTHSPDPPQLVISRVEPALPSPSNPIDPLDDPMAFSIIEISPLADEYSFVDISQTENMLLEGEDCKKILPLVARFRSVFNIPMARSLCVACKKVYERESEKGRKLLRGFSMQESYLGPLLQAINARLEAVTKELEQLGPGELAKVQDYETEIDNRLAVAPANPQAEAIYEEIKVLSKVGTLHFPNYASTFDEYYSTSMRALKAQSQ